MPLRRDAQSRLRIRPDLIRDGSALDWRVVGRGIKTEYCKVSLLFQLTLYGHNLLHKVDQVDIRKQLPVSQSNMCLSTRRRVMNRDILQRPPFIQFILERLPRSLRRRRMHSTTTPTLIRKPQNAHEDIKPSGDHSQAMINRQLPTLVACGGDPLSASEAESMRASRTLLPDNFLEVVDVR